MLEDEILELTENMKTLMTIAFAVTLIYSWGVVEQKKITLIKNLKGDY